MSFKGLLIIAGISVAGYTAYKAYGSKKKNKRKQLLKKLKSMQKDTSAFLDEIKTSFTKGYYGTAKA